jgi:hypothetical protein
VSDVLIEQPVLVVGGGRPHLPPAEAEHCAAVAVGGRGHVSSVASYPLGAFRAAAAAARGGGAVSGSSSGECGAVSYSQYVALGGAGADDAVSEGEE